MHPTDNSIVMCSRNAATAVVNRIGKMGCICVSLLISASENDDDDDVLPSEEEMIQYKP